MIIDAWMQLPDTAFLERPWFDSLKRWLGDLGSLPDVSAEMAVGAMDHAGVQQGLVCAWWGPQGELISHARVKAAVDAFPDRLVGVASADLSRPMAAVRELRRAVREDGFKALRILPWLWGLPPNDRRYYPLYAECIELGIPVCTQIGHTGPLLSSEPGRPIPYIEDVLIDFPELVFVGGHVGAPWMAEVLLLARKFEGFYIDTSAYVPRRYPPELVDFMRGRGRHKVLFASNFPMLPPSRCVAGVEALGLDEEAHALFMGGNARRVYGL